MAEYTNLASLFGDVADAIRDKTGSDELIKAEAFPEAIEGIPQVRERDTSAIALIDRTITEYIDTEEYITYCGSSAFIDCSALERVELKKANFLGEWCFYSCTSLQTATFRDVTQIDAYCFRGCTSLESLYLLGDEIPNLGGYVFSSTPMLSSGYLHGEHGSVFCRASLVEDMRVAKNWSAIASRITSLPEEMEAELESN